MRAIWRNLIGVGVALALSACVAAGRGGKSAEPNPITGAEIEVTALDAPAPQKTGAQDKPATPDKPPAAGATPAAAKPALPAAPAEKPATGPKPRPEPAGTAAAKEEVAAPEAAPPVPEAEKSAAQIACERKGDLWAKAGSSGASACVKRTRVAGKHCKTGKDCQGECLARSNTCSPYAPLFGCNDILQDNGVRMTLCLD